MLRHGAFHILLLAIFSTASPVHAMVSSRAISQFVNIDALGMLRRVATQPSLAVPHLRVAHVGCVDWAALHSGGIRGVVFDKDNTLTAPYVDELADEAVKAITTCREVFGSDKLLVMSNSAGGRDDTGWQTASKVEASLGLEVLRHGKKKPAGGDELMSWFRDKDEAKDIAPHQLAFVGDRLLTDVVFGNLHGMLTVHVQPLTVRGDNPAGLVVRSVENRLLLPLLRWKRPPPHPASRQG